MHDYFLFGGASVAIVASMLVFLGNVLKVRVDAEKSLAAAKKTEDFNNKLNAKNEELLAKGAEIERLNKELFTWVTGGDDYARLTPRAISNGESDFMLSNLGKYPLHDVTVSIYSYAPVRRVIRKNPQDHQKIFAAYQAAKATIQIGTLHPSSARFLDYRVVMPKDLDESLYQITILARNRTVVFEILYKLIGGVWNIATRVRDSEGTFIHTSDGLNLFKKSEDEERERGEEEQKKRLLSTPPPPVSTPPSLDGTKQ
jgi:hypothetical protein